MGRVDSAFPSFKVKLKPLFQIVEDLEAGKSFSVTRLISIKSLCTDSTASQAFALYISGLAKQKMDTRGKPDHLNQEKWLQFKHVVEKTLIALKEAQEQGIENIRSHLQYLLEELRTLQNDYKNQQWGPVRIVLSSETLVMEYAVECFLSTSQAPYWAYSLARSYAEQYDSEFGNGLVPKSAPMVEEIAIFWRNYFLNQIEKG